MRIPASSRLLLLLVTMVSASGLCSRERFSEIWRITLPTRLAASTTAAIGTRTLSIAAATTKTGSGTMPMTTMRGTRQIHEFKALRAALTHTSINVCQCAMCACVFACKCSALKCLHRCRSVMTRCFTAGNTARPTHRSMMRPAAGFACSIMISLFHVLIVREATTHLLAVAVYVMRACVCGALIDHYGVSASSLPRSRRRTSNMQKSWKGLCICWYRCDL